MLIFLAVFCIMPGKSQDYLVIDTNQTNISKYNIYETLWNSLPCDPPLNLNVDVNGDGSNDCFFRSECYSGSYGSDAELTLWTYGYNGCSYVVDTMVVDSTLVIGTGQYIVDPFRIVEKYSYGDTIPYQGSYLNNETIIVHVHSYPPGMSGPGSQLYLDDWIGGDHYIGFKKTINDIVYLGWIKVEVVHSQRIIVKESVLYDPAMGISEHEPDAMKISPNPAYDHFFFQNLAYEQIKIINISGQLCLNLRLSQGLQTIDISSLYRGMYIIQFTGGNKVQSYCKLIKQ